MTTVTALLACFLDPFSSLHITVHNIFESCFYYMGTNINLKKNLQCKTMAKPEKKLECLSVYHNTLLSFLSGFQVYTIGNTFLSLRRKLCQFIVICGVALPKPLEDSISAHPLGVVVAILDGEG